MIDIRQFIRNLGDDAPAYFDVKKETITRWVKTGNVPIKVAQKIFAAASAVEKAAPAPVAPEPQAQTNEDPLTHLPNNMERRLPQITGKPPETIELNPVEQSFGNNFTRPGRLTPRPTGPMKLRNEGGQMVAYREDTPALADMKNPDGTPKIPALPPQIAGADWADKGTPLPAPKKALNPNEPRSTQATPEGVQKS